MAIGLTIGTALGCGYIIKYSTAEWIDSIYKEKNKEYSHLTVDNSQDKTRESRLKALDACYETAKTADCIGNYFLIGGGLGALTLTFNPVALTTGILIGAGAGVIGVAVTTFKNVTSAYKGL